MREVGPAYATSLVLRRIIPRWLFYHRHIYVMQRSLDGWADKPHDDPNLRLAGKQDADLIGQLVWDTEKVRDSLSEGAQIAMVVRDGRVQAASWFKQGQVAYEHWLTLVTPEDAVCSMFVFTAKDARGQGHFGRVVKFNCRESARAGLARTVSIVDHLNRNSWSATMKIGGQRVGTIRVWGVFGFLLVKAGSTWRTGRWDQDRRLALGFDELGT